MKAITSGLILFVILIWCATIFLLHDYQDRGTFGDMFGAANALFSGLAFVGVITAILLQKNELKLQREELGYTRAELKGQKEQLRAQSRLIEQQNFESTFFHLLKLQNEIVSSMFLPDASYRELSGRECLKAFYNTLARLWDQKGATAPSEAEIDIINKIYIHFYDKHHHHIGHYIRGLCNIFRFVDLSNTSDKDFYMGLAVDQLSSYELYILFYHSLSDDGLHEFKPLIEKYSLFRNIDEHLLLEPEGHKPLYNRSAFGEVGS